NPPNGFAPRMSRVTVSPQKFTVGNNMVVLLSDLSNLEGLQISHALLREFPVLLDEIVLDSAALRGLESLHPVNGAFAHRNLRISGSASPGRRSLWRGCRSRGVHIYILEMHREEAARILLEVVRRDKAGGDRGHLKLELHQLRIEQLQ